MPKLIQKLPHKILIYRATPRFDAGFGVNLSGSVVERTSFVLSNRQRKKLQVRDGTKD